jgi:hypothetical protein
MEAKQYGAAVSALREEATIAGLRVERAEKGQPGAFANLSDAELDRLLEEEYRRIKALPARSDNVVPIGLGSKLS